MNRARLPWLLVALRAALGPVIVCVALTDPFSSRLMVPALLVIAVLSDVFDGVLARKWGVSTPALRVWDSNIDLFFWSCAGLALLTSVPQAVASIGGLLIAIVVIECVAQVAAYARFQRSCATHALSAKLWGLLLGIGSVLTFAQDSVHPLLKIALGVGIYAQLESMAIVQLMPAYQTDIPSVFAALRLRRGQPIARHALLNG